MNIQELLVALENANVSLLVHGNDIICQCNKQLITSDLWISLKQNKEPLIEIVKSGRWAGSARRAEILAPPVLIKPDSPVITPDMLSLIDLNQEDIHQIIEHVPGGIANIQDIYALAPLQDGILFHHLLARGGDPYLLTSQLAFPERRLLDRFLSAVQQVVKRHDILRTAFIWERLSKPAQVVWRQAQLSVTQVEHERFFRQMLGEVTEPTLPFGLSDVQQDGGEITESHRMLPQSLNDRLRVQARRLGVSLASLCHLAWSQVLARSSGQERVVFGTVLFGRMQGGEGADQGVGLFINTLPLRLDLDDTGMETAVRQTHARIAGLLTHEHASLALAQRCSGVTAPSPLFSAILNYRHNLKTVRVEDTEEPNPLAGVQFLSSEERTNYPLTLSVEDYGEALGLTALVTRPVSPERVCGYMQQALESLVLALETAPHTPVRQLEILPPEERELLLETWNATAAPYPEHVCIQELFEEQAGKNPEATAVVYEQQSLSYGELNRQANRLAHHLISLGVKPDDRVAICMERSPGMVI